MDPLIYLTVSLPRIRSRQSPIDSEFTPLSATVSLLIALWQLIPLQPRIVSPCFQMIVQGSAPFLVVLERSSMLSEGLMWPASTLEDFARLTPPICRFLDW